jgi:hypothetical protein
MLTTLMAHAIGGPDDLLWLFVTLTLAVRSESGGTPLDFVVSM